MLVYCIKLLAFLYCSPCICLSRFVMLSLAKHCCVRLCSFCLSSKMKCFHLLPCCKRWSPKIKANPNRSARFAGLRTATLNCFLHHAYKYKNGVSFLFYTTFSKAHAVTLLKC